MEAQRLTGIPASVTIAQAALESGWGAFVPEGSFNYFGVKRGSWAGAYTVQWTREEHDGHSRVVRDSFRVYSSLREACIDHALVFYNGAYEPALAHRRQPMSFARLIAPTYATDGRYGEKLVYLIERYQLHRFDLPLEAWRLDPGLVPERWMVWRLVAPVPELPRGVEAVEAGMFETVSDWLWAAFIVVVSALMGSLVNPMRFKEQEQARPGKRLEEPGKGPRFQEF